MEKKKTKRKYRKYDESFKKEVLLQIKNGRSIKEVSASLGVGESLLYRWKSESEGKIKDTNLEVKALRRQLKQLEAENEILKKALSIFSRSD